MVNSVTQSGYLSVTLVTSPEKKVQPCEQVSRVTGFMELRCNTLRNLLPLELSVILELTPSVLTLGLLNLLAP